MTAIEEMAGMDVLCSDKTGTLTLNKLSVDKNLIEVEFNCYDSSDFCFRIAKFFYFPMSYNLFVGICERSGCGHCCTHGSQGISNGEPRCN